MARSIDDDKTFTFDIETVDLGVSTQGYTITAPLLVPATTKVADGPTEAVQSLQLEMKYQPLYAAIADLGVGAFSLRRVHDHLRDKLDGTGLYDAAAKLRANSTELSAFLLSLIPRTGKNTQAGANITLETTEKRGGYPIITFVHVRKFES